MFLIGFYEMVEYLAAFLDNKRNGPGEEIHKVGQKIGMRTVYKLLDV